jgi:hypothetical protein
VDFDIFVAGIASQRNEFVRVKGIRDVLKKVA